MHNTLVIRDTAQRPTVQQQDFVSFAVDVYSSDYSVYAFWLILCDCTRQYESVLSKELLRSSPLHGALLLNLTLARTWKGDANPK